MDDSTSNNVNDARRVVDGCFEYLLLRKWSLKKYIELTMDHVDDIYTPYYSVLLSDAMQSKAMQITLYDVVYLQIIYYICIDVKAN